MRIPRILLSAILALAAFWSFGCGNKEGARVPNERPVVVIKGGPLDGSTASYTTRIFWSGWDEDGIVTHYEYAIDPPLAFTNREIADPENSPGLTLEVLPGPGAFQDTLIWSKVEEGETYSYTWVQTREFSRAFAFETPVADSQFVGGQVVPKEQFSGAHVVYVRCRDNDGDYSDVDPTNKDENGRDILDVDYIGYTATTQTPRAEITRPQVAQEIMDLGATLSARWDGLDPDSPEADKKPKGYIYKLLRLDTLVPPIPVLNARPELLYTRGGDWIYQDGDTLEKVLQLGVPGQYIFGVRAVDLAGAVEPLLALGRNVFKFQAFPNGGKPELTVREPSAGVFVFRGVGAPQEAEVPAARRLRFSWSATAEAYGGTVEAYSWGLDIPDLDVEGPESGWSGWGPITSTGDPIVFPSGGTHVLYIRVRDVAGAITLASLILNVVEFPFDREVLLIDDSFDDTFPRDSEHDAFWRSMVSYYAANSDIPEDQFFVFDAHGPNDRGNLDPNVPQLSDLGRYKLLIWECRGSGYNAQTSLVNVTALSPKMAAYLGAGGKLWVGGRMTVAATTPEPNRVGGDLTYPKENMGPGDFAWDFLKLHSTKIINDKGEKEQNLFNRANPFPQPPVYDRQGVVVQDLPYDTLVVDLPKINLGQRSKGGYSHADAIQDPIFAEAEPDFIGNVDSLYVYGAAGNEFQGRNSNFHGKLTGLRWSDPDPDRRHGRIQWFGFSMYFSKNAQAERVFKRSIDWFREEQVPLQP